MFNDNATKPVSREPAGSLFSFSQRLNRIDASLLLMLPGGSILTISLLPSIPFVIWEIGLIIFSTGCLMLFTGVEENEKPIHN